MVCTPIVAPWVGTSPDHLLSVFSPLVAIVIRSVCVLSSCANANFLLSMRLRITAAILHQPFRGSSIRAVARAVHVVTPLSHDGRLASCNVRRLRTDGYGLSANYLAIAELAPNGFPAIKAEP